MNNYRMEHFNEGTATGNVVRALLLSAGLGKRLGPLTENWPKCLMPVKKVPILYYWLFYLRTLGIKEIMINTHSNADEVKEFVSQSVFRDSIMLTKEEELLGTGGSLYSNIEYFRDGHLLMVHSDNFCITDFHAFFFHHFHRRNNDSLLSMMTFETDNPSGCGMLSVNHQGVVTEFIEKPTSWQGRIANGAVYLLTPTLIDRIRQGKKPYDFSRDIIPSLVGEISAWHNNNIHIDIGTIENLRKAEALDCDTKKFHDGFIQDLSRGWVEYYLQRPIHLDIWEGFHHPSLRGTK